MSYFYFLMMLIMAIPAFAEDSSQQFTNFMNRVVQNSPEIKANLAEEQSYREEVRMARSGYLPKINFEALDTTGFPASTSALDVSGVMGSPFRSGAAGGFTLQQELWDFGRTSAEVETAKRRVEATQFSKELTAEDVKALATSAFFNCARETATAEVWQESVTETDHIHHEVLKFMRTGQKSVVDEKLSLLEVETANRKYEHSTITLTSLKNKMNVLTGEKTANLQCLSLAQLENFKAPASGNITESPKVLLAQARTKVAESELSRAKADYLPSLVGFASIGLMENRRLVDSNQDYSLGIGLVFPIFEGFKVDASVNRASAKVSENQETANAEEQRFRLELESLNESIQVSEAELARLKTEVKDADDALKLAQTRYFGFQGSLIDLREAQRAVVQVKLDWVDRLTAFLFAQSEKAILSRSF